MAKPMRPQIRADCPINPDPTKPVQTTCLLPDCPVHGMVIEPMTMQQRDKIELERLQVETEARGRTIKALLTELDDVHHDLRLVVGNGYTTAGSAAVEIMRRLAVAEADLARAQQCNEALAAELDNYHRHEYQPKQLAGLIRCGWHRCYGPENDLRHRTSRVVIAEADARWWASEDVDGVQIEANDPMVRALTGDGDGDQP